MKSAERNKQIVIMRAAGHNILDIARSLGASVSTIQRTLRKYPTSKGVASKALIEAAREELQEFLGHKVHLFLQIKVRPNWLEEKERYSEMGLDFRDGS